MDSIDLSWMNDLQLHRQIASEVFARYDRDKDSLELFTLRTFIDNINNERVKNKKDAREEFKTVKKNVKSEALKEIAKDLEQAIFGGNDDNNRNNGDNDDKKRTFAPPNGDFVNKILENRNKENESNRNNDNNKNFLKLSKLNKEPKKNLNELSNKIDKIREIKASKNSLNK